MEKNFFTIANPKFFNPLVGKNKEINYDLLCLINDALDKDTQIDKSEMVYIIADYFRNHPGYENFDDNDPNKRSDSRSLPHDKLRYFEECGWIASEATNNFKQVYEMEPIAVEVLRSMNTMVERETKPIESAGLVYNIYISLKNFDLKQATYITERLLEDSRTLNVSLRTVSSRIRRYLNNLMADDNQSPRKILKELLLNYQNNVVARSFNNLRTNDNPSKYKDDIISIVFNLRKEHMDELVEDYVQIKYGGKHSVEHDLVAKNFFEFVFDQLTDQFFNIDKVISILEMQNSRYVSSARKRINFLMNDKMNIEGQIDNILMLLEKNNVNNDIEFTFNLDDKGKIDDTSLYVYTKNRNPEPTILDFQDLTYDEEMEMRYIEKIRWQRKFAISSVNRFIMEALGDKDELLASEVKINDFDDFIILFLAQIFSESDLANYYVETVQAQDIIYENRKINNFMIKRRKQR